MTTCSSSDTLQKVRKLSSTLSNPSQLLRAAYHYFYRDSHQCSCRCDGNSFPRQSLYFHRVDVFPHWREDCHVVAPSAPLLAMTWQQSPLPCWEYPYG